LAARARTGPLPRWLFLVKQDRAHRYRQGGNQPVLESSRAYKQGWSELEAQDRGHGLRCVNRRWPMVSSRLPRSRTRFANALDAARTGRWKEIREESASLRRLGSRACFVRCRGVFRAFVSQPYVMCPSRPRGRLTCTRARSRLWLFLHATGFTRDGKAGH
jgi:hypothetical protein